MKITLSSELRPWAQLENIQVIINQNKILSNININLYFGDNILILGPNGSGKTTFLKLLNRSIYPIVSRDSSFRLFNNENINIWDLRKEIGFLFKEMEKRVNKGVKLKDLIISGFSGTFNSKYSKSLSEIDRKKLNILIRELDLIDIINNEFHSLSDGQKRRGMLARAIVYQPKILVLDEPFCNLDIKSNLILNKTLTKLINDSVNIIYITHSLESIIPKTNRVILLKGGKIINDGKPEQIIKSSILSNLFDVPIKVIKEGDYWRSIPAIN
tara:strand:+ start:298 stop:1110 length:813 start_codon:yes stop_codon:yes gene_type:complete